MPRGEKTPPVVLFAGCGSMSLSLYFDGVAKIPLAGV
jgi:hypothetical protein